MNKTQTTFECSKCGAQYPKWAGRCSECGAWGTVSDSKISSSPVGRTKVSESAVPAQVLDFSRVEAKNIARIETGIKEFDRVLGNGIVPGSLVLLGGDPGIGKSTLLLQIISQSSNQWSSLYVSGEESAEQVKLRSDRLGLNSENLKFLSETNIDTICATIKKIKP